MNIFVVDNNIYSSTLRNMGMEYHVFDHIYEPWSKGMSNGSIISVDEVYSELKRLFETKKDKKWEWIDNYRAAFKFPNDEEGEIVKEIYKNPKFRERLKEKDFLGYNPGADAFLVAKAKYVGGIVVTDESNTKPNSDRIPNICVEFKIPYIQRQKFYLVLKNMYEGNHDLKDVTLHYDLDTK